MTGGPEFLPRIELPNGEVFYQPHQGKQTEAVQQLLTRVLYGVGPSKVFLRGNRGGGKSKLVRQGVLHPLALHLPGLKYGVVRRNYPDLQKNHLVHVGREMRLLDGDYNKTEHQANYANGSIGFYFQCEDERDVDKIVGAELGVLFVDEAPQIKWEFLRTISPSLRIARGPDGTQPYYILEIYGGNPIGESIEELDKYCLEKDVDPFAEPEYDPNDWGTIEIGLKDNPSLDPAEYLKQFAGVPAHFRAAWIDGVRMDSRTLFQVHKTKQGQPYHYIQELPRVDKTPLLQVPWMQVYRVFDMGFFPDPAVCLWVAVVGRRIIVFHEETWFQTTAPDLAVKMRETTRELIGETPVVMTYADPEIDVQRGAEVTVRDLLEIGGVPIECSVNDRVLYADMIHALLGEEVEPGVPRLQIYEPGCPMLAKYLPKMRWDEKNPRKMADHKFDHWIVCLAYFAISSGVLSLSTPASQPAKETPGLQWMREDAALARRRRSA